MAIHVESITTKFGTARLYNGYWRITSSKEGNHLKSLHRLIYEYYHKCTLLSNAVIHHKDGCRSNNRLSNLELMSSLEHKKHHRVGENNPLYGKECSNELKKRISLSESKSRNTTNYYRVSKDKNKSCKQGFTWIYQYCEEGKHKKINSVDIKKLEAKVKAKGLPWFKLEKEGNHV